MSKKWVDVSKIGEIASRGKVYTEALVGSLSEITKGAINELDEAKQDVIAGGEGSVVGFDKTGELTTVPMWSNENLFRNADFRNPENQNGQTTYTVDSITNPVSCINHWQLIGHGQLIVEDECIRLVPSEDGEYVAMYQDIHLSAQRHILGNPLTTSVFGTGPMVAYFSGYNSTTGIELNIGWSSLTVPGNASLTGESKCYNRTYEDLSLLTEGEFLRGKIAALSANGEARFSAVKLERGRLGTLGYKTESNAWALNTVMPSYEKVDEKIVGLPGALASYNNDGVLGSFNGTPGALVGIGQDGKAKSVDPLSIVSASVRVNKNLIPNWNFQNALNSGWKDFYPDDASNVKTCLDGWMIPNGSMQLIDISKVSYVLSSKENSDLAQTVLTTGTLWTGRNGSGPMTLSFLVGNVLNGSVRASVAFDNGSKYSTEVAESGEYGDSKALLTVTVNSPGKAATILIEHMGGTSLRFTPYAIKFEEGSFSTLAYHDSTLDDYVLFESAIDEISVWAATHKRVPVGQNLLINADFERFDNPGRRNMLYPGESMAGWELAPDTKMNLNDLSRTKVSFIESTVYSELNPKILEQKGTIIIKRDEPFTLSAIFDEVEGGSGYPIVKIFRDGGSSNGDYFLAEITEFIDGVGWTTFSTISANPLGIKVTIEYPLDGQTTHRYKPVRIKLERGSFQTITRDEDYSPVDIALRVLPPHVNDNLLINGDFRNFINESGYDDSVSANHIIGCWRTTITNDGFSNLIVGGENIPSVGVRFSSTIYTASTIFHPCLGQGITISTIGVNHPSELTLTVIYRTRSISGKLGEYRLYANNPGGSGYVTASVPSSLSAFSIFSHTFDISLWTSDTLYVGLEDYAADEGANEIDLLAIKAEFGRTQTLARYGPGGEIQFLSPPTPERERERCHKRSLYYRHNFDWVFGFKAYDLNHMYFLFPKLESAPSTIDNSNFAFFPYGRSPGSNVAVSSRWLPIRNFFGLYVQSTISQLNSGNDYIGVFVTPNGKPYHINANP